MNKTRKVLQGSWNMEDAVALGELPLFYAASVAAVGAGVSSNSPRQPAISFLEQQGHQITQGCQTVRRECQKNGWRAPNSVYKLCTSLWKIPELCVHRPDWKEAEVRSQLSPEESGQSP